MAGLPQLRWLDQRAARRAWRVQEAYTARLLRAHSRGPEPDPVASDLMDVLLLYSDEALLQRLVGIAACTGCGPAWS